MIEVDCPACAAKLEKCASEQPGVERCTVNLMTQKMNIFAPEEMQQEIIERIAAQMKKIDDDVVINF